MKSLAIHTKLALLAGLLWALPWGYLVIQDVLTRSTIGRGAAGAVDMHEAFELLFVAAHFGVRMLVGLGVIAALWGVVHLFAQRRRTGPLRLQEVAGD